MSRGLVLKALHQKPIAYYRIYKDITNSTATGVVLSQLMYWGEDHDKFWKTDKSIIEDTGVTPSELRNAKKRIKKLPFIEVTVEGVPAKTYYTINWDKTYDFIHDYIHDSITPNQFSEIHQTRMVNLTNPYIEKNTLKNTRKDPFSREKVMQAKDACIQDKGKDSVAKKSTGMLFKRIVKKEDPVPQPSAKPKRPPRPRPPKKTPRSKKIITDTTMKYYSWFKKAGATDHKVDSQAYYNTLDNIQGLFKKGCVKPYASCNTKIEFDEKEWDYEEVELIFLYQMKVMKAKGKSPIRNIGDFIVTRGFKARNAWSPLLSWCNEKKHPNSLLPEGEALYKSFMRAGIDEVMDLEIQILNVVGKDLIAMDKRYGLYDENDSITYPMGIIDYFAKKYIKKQMNSSKFMLEYMRKEGFVNKFVKVALKNNGIRKKSNGKRR